MKIQNSCAINFGSRKLYCARLSQKYNPDVKKDVFVSELDPSDEERAIDSLLQWNNTAFGWKIIEDFLFGCHFAKFKIGHDFRYFVVEDLAESPENQFKSMIIAEPYKNNMYIPNLQSQTETDFENPLKGAGSCLMYAIIKLAQDMGKNSISLISTPKAQGFYRKIGMMSPFEFQLNYVLHKKDFKDVLSKIKEKYSISEIKN